MTPRPTNRRIRRAAVWRVMAVGGAAALVVPLASGMGVAAQAPANESTTGPIVPADPQQWTDQAEMTWDDYVSVRPPEWNSAETSQGTEVQYQTAVILIDFENQPFLITQEPETHPFGNPQSGWQPVPQEDVNDWFYDYYAVPNGYNGGQTLHSYWMEDSHGRIGVDVEVFGPYTMPHNWWQYGLSEWGANSLNTNQCPAQADIPTGGTGVTELNVTTTDFFYVGDRITIRHDMFPSGGGRPPLTINRTVVDIPDGNTLVLDEPVDEIWDGARVHDCGLNIRTDGGSAWRAAIGCESGLCGFDNGFYVTAGHDESSTWEEFGQMLFAEAEDVPDEFGNPNPNLPNSSVTRYVPWTSWYAAANHWPNAGGGTSTQAESSGQSVFAHEFSHLRGLPDNYNNPFADNIRNYTGYWEMMSRGTFNGPGGTHNRWQIPNAGGSALGPHHMVHFKQSLGVLDESEQVLLDRSQLLTDGVAVASVKARSAIPNGDQVGFEVELDDGGYVPGNCQALIPEDPGFWCPPSSNWENFSMEVVEQVGNDSFVPGHGVLLAQNRIPGSPDVWMIDPNPEDIGRIDYFRPDGTAVPVVRGDPRQLDDATFHAGTDSDSEYEYVEEFNRLHFYVLDAYRDEDGVLFYDVAARHLDGAGDFARGAELDAAGNHPVGSSTALVTTALTNTGEAGEGVFDSDVYRLSASVDGDGWDVHLPYEVVAAASAESVPVWAYATAGAGATESAMVTVTATSETDSSVSATLQVEVTKADLKVTLDTASELVGVYYADGVIATNERNQLSALLNVISNTTGKAAQNAVDQFEKFAERIADVGARNLASAALVSVAGDLRSDL